jgi:inosose dehydratase
MTNRDGSPTADAGLQLATGPVCWGVDFADAPGNPAWPDVLDEIGRSGVKWLELGPVGYLPEHEEALRAELEARGLGAVGTFLFEPLHDPAQRELVAAKTRRTCDLVAAGGGGLLVVIDAVSDARSSSAGRPDDAPRLGARDREALLETLRVVVAIAHEHEVRPVIHPHAGTFIEFEDEIDAVLSSFEDEELGLCVDTGHSAYAGLDPAKLAATYADRLEHLHLKDVDPEVVRRAVEGSWSFWRASDAGVFCPLGDGAVDFRAFARELAAGGFTGFATIEQDRLAPGALEEATEDLRRSVSYLHDAGLAGTIRT